MWRWLLGLAILAGALFGIVLGALNPDPVTLKLIFIEWTASLGAAIALSAGVGLALGFGLAVVLMMFRRPAGRRKTERTPEASQSLTDV